jgi:hypothetical protein
MEATSILKTFLHNKCTQQYTRKTTKIMTHKTQDVSGTIPLLERFG